jgi:hypothetical protein
VNGSRLPNAAHEEHPWLIAAIAPDFQLLDVWRLPAHGRREEFASLVEIMTSLDPARGDSKLAGALFRLRLRLGELFGWDDPSSDLAVPGRSERTLSARIPEALRESVAGGDGERPSIGSTSFTPLYRTAEEWAAELSNRTVHGVVHLAWVPEGDGYRGQMAVFVKPRGRLGVAYMALISPFRHLIVYPALMRQIGRAWDARRAQDDVLDARPSRERPDRPL